MTSLPYSRSELKSSGSSLSVTPTVVRLLPNMQRAVLNRFRRRGDAENYMYLLRRYLPDTKIEIIFDPPSSETPPPSHKSAAKSKGGDRIAVIESAAGKQSLHTIPDYPTFSAAQ